MYFKFYPIWAIISHLGDWSQPVKIIFLPKIDVLILNNHTTLCFAFLRNHVKSLNVQGLLQGEVPEGGYGNLGKQNYPLPPPPSENLDLLMHYIIWFLKMGLDPPPPPTCRKQNHLSPKDISCRAYRIIETYSTNLHVVHLMKRRLN